jgi:hypothetical protein
MKFFNEFFCRNRNLMVPRACDAKFLKLVFDLAEIFDLNISAYAQPAMKSIPRMLSQRWSSLGVCSVCDEIRSAYAQHVFTCKNCSHFTAGWACAKILSLYAQCVMKSLPRMLSVRQNRFCLCSSWAYYNFRKLLKNPRLKCKFRL